MDNCIFCKIGKGEIPAHKVYEDQKMLAFLDVKPHSKGHTVVIPKTHGVTVFDFSDKQLQELMVAVRKTVERIQKVLSPDGFNVGWNHNTAAGQVVPHLHVHIMPRYL
ncbi:MAG: HIT family protein, partial [Nanoarchaeota archaeon]